MLILHTTDYLLLQRPFLPAGMRSKDQERLLGELTPDAVYSRPSQQ